MGQLAVMGHQQKTKEKRQPFQANTFSLNSVKGCDWLHLVDLVLAEKRNLNNSILYKKCNVQTDVCSPYHPPYVIRDMVNCP